MNSSNNKLARVLGFWALVIYGVGDILGAGIYSLVGTVAGIAGQDSWKAFLLAWITASLTALSYAELSGRVPKSGGAASFCLKGYKSPTLSIIIGWMVLCSGMVSMATVSIAFAGYLQAIFPKVAAQVWIVSLFTLLYLLNIRGMRESSLANMVCTAIEVLGLIIVIVASYLYLGSDSSNKIAEVGEMDTSFSTVLQGGVVAFFAFIGFEDLVNVAEDAKSPQRDIPRAILLALTVAGLLYIAVIVAVVRVVPPEVLASSTSPLVDVVAVASPMIPKGLFSFIAVFAIANTALLNYIMGSRILYGMAQDALLPRWVGKLHSTRKTPYIAITLIFFVAVTLALSGSMAYLAGTTSALLLIIFSFVNGSLIIMKRRNRDYQGFKVPMIIPLIGVLTTLFLVAFTPPTSIFALCLLLIPGVLIILWKYIDKVRYMN